MRPRSNHRLSRFSVSPSAEWVREGPPTGSAGGVSGFLPALDLCPGFSGCAEGRWLGGGADPHGLEASALVPARGASFIVLLRAVLLVRGGACLAFWKPDPHFTGRRMEAQGEEEERTCLPPPPPDSFACAAPCAPQGGGGESLQSSWEHLALGTSLLWSWGEELCSGPPRSLPPALPLSLPVILLDFRHIVLTVPPPSPAFLPAARRHAMTVPM